MDIRSLSVDDKRALDLACRAGFGRDSDALLQAGVELTDHEMAAVIKGGKELLLEGVDEAVVSDKFLLNTLFLAGCIRKYEDTMYEAFPMWRDVWDSRREAGELADALASLAQFKVGRGFRLPRILGPLRDLATGFAKCLWNLYTGIFPSVPGIAVTRLNRRAGLLFHQGYYDRAIAVATKAVRVAEHPNVPEYPDLAQSLVGLASIHEDQGEYVQAVPIIKRALAIFEKNLGPDHPDVVWYLNNLADLYRFQGRYMQAIVRINRVLEINEKVLSPEHPNAVESRNKLAALYKAQGQ